ncbi:MAG: glutamine synthetase III, partial [Rectinemataceae bacterium]
ASSFASGGLRATFEARGYTAWDVTSPAFLKRNADRYILCIPTAFVSYTGHALDKKVPLLRSMEALNRAGLRLLRTLGDTRTRRIITAAGPEQEYFLVNASLYARRPDLMLCGRTLLGSMPAKGQELEDHYYGAIDEKAAAFMNELNSELWAMGIAAKTQHNEVAPNQFEIACIYSEANIAADANQLVMETIRKVAAHHGLAALLHEKPFDGINGSGKHINWSVATDRGVNPFDPGLIAAAKDEAEASLAFLRFVLFSMAVIEAVDKRAGLLRAATATAGNDRRLGGHEAPPSILSVFLGEPLLDLFDSLENGGGRNHLDKEFIELGIRSLPKLPKDFSDRNRTSPFAFTGNKFEFRMVGSSQSVSTPLTMLNAAVAEALNRLATRMEQLIAEGRPLLEAARITAAETWKEHRRVVFNGNGYSEEWAREAARRGLPMFRSAVDAIQELVRPENLGMLTSLGVFLPEEVEARYTIYLDRYSKQIKIEAGLMLDMIKRSILPAVVGAAARYARNAADLSAVGASALTAETLSRKLAQYGGRLSELTEKLEKVLAEALKAEQPLDRARVFRDAVVPQMDELRNTCDEVERVVPREDWPLPTYGDLLFTL